MRIVVVGAGAREHALTWALSQDSKNQVWTLPGNAGCPHSRAIAVDDFAGIEAFCKNERVDLIVVGQETSLALGIQNTLSKSGFYVFGPSREAARLESSKIWSKQFMQRHSVQTAPFRVVHSLNEAEDVIREWNGDCVIKWDGLAAGKGVAVCETLSQAEEALSQFHSKFSSMEFVIEKRLQGRELSVFAVTNGEQYCLLAPAKDYKRAFDGDKGPNTGGMGAVSSNDLWDEGLRRTIEDSIVKPTLAGLKNEKISYTGFLYFGIMIQEGIPYLLEYNVRLGDPESSAVLPRLKTPLLEIITSCLEHSMDQLDLQILEDPCVNVVLASEGYPGSYKTGYKIDSYQRLDSDSTFLFHAGTRKGERGLVSSGGRILNCAALAPTLKEAQAKAYAMCAQVEIPSSFYRSDIGEDCF